MADAPAGLQAFFERAFSRVPGERFDSPRQLVDELGMALQGQGTSDVARSRGKGEQPAREVRTVSPFATTQGPKQSNPRSQRQRVWVFGAFVLLLGLLGLGWLSLHENAPAASTAGAASPDPPAKRSVVPTAGSVTAVPSPAAQDSGVSTCPSR